MSRKPKNAPAGDKELNQTIAVASNGEAAAASEASASVIETIATADKSSEPKAGRMRKAAKLGRAKKIGAKAKKADTTTKEGKAERKKPGRKPMTTEQRAEAARARAEEKRKAANMKPAIIVEYSGEQADANSLVERAKEAFHAERKRTLITDLKLYVKPEERAAYYVVNERFTGKIDF